MKDELRELSRRIKDLQDIAGRLNLARRNAMTLDALRSEVERIEDFCQGRAKLLTEYANDLIDEANKMATALKATSAKSKDKVH